MFRVISKIFKSVYNEFGKLDSLEEKLSPKLKALLAAGLIGTASLGMQSCAQPTGDDPYYGDGTNTEVTAPAPEDNTPTDNTTDNPTDNTPTDTADDNNKENTKNNGENTPVKEIVWQKLGISEADANLLEGQYFDSMGLGTWSKVWAKQKNGHPYIYQNGAGFVEVSEAKANDYENDTTTGCYATGFDTTNGSFVTYCIPSGTDAYDRIDELKKELSWELPETNSIVNLNGGPSK